MTENNLFLLTALVIILLLPLINLFLNLWLLLYILEISRPYTYFFISIIIFRLCVVLIQYELWGLKLNVKKTKYIAIGDTSRNLQLEDGKGTINHVTEYVYLGVRIT